MGDGRKQTTERAESQWLLWKETKAGASTANQRKGLQAAYLVTTAASAEDAAAHV